MNSSMTQNKKSLQGAKGQMAMHPCTLHRNLSNLQALQTIFLQREGSTAANISLEDQMALLKAPISGSKEIYSSRGRMCRISLVDALATAESRPSDVCAPESMTIILFSCVQDIKQCPLSTEKQIEGTGFTASLCSLHCLLGRKIGSLMLQPCVHAAAMLLQNIYVRLKRKGRNAAASR